MNCKPGDLAMVVRSWDGCSCHIGVVVHVLTWHYSPAGEIWQLEEPVRGCHHYFEPLWNMDRIRDAVLKPLPPEDDVRQYDQQKEIEHAG